MVADLVSLTITVVIVEVVAVSGALSHHPTRYELILVIAVEMDTYVEKSDGLDWASSGKAVFKNNDRKKMVIFTRIGSYCRRTFWSNLRKNVASLCQRYANQTLLTQLSYICREMHIIAAALFNIKMRLLIQPTNRRNYVKRALIQVCFFIR